MESSTWLHPGNVYLEASPLNIDFACVKSCIFTHIMCVWPQTWLSSFQLLITSSLYHISTFWLVGCIWIGRWTRSILSFFHFCHSAAPYNHWPFIDSNHTKPTNNWLRLLTICVDNIDWMVLVLALMIERCCNLLTHYNTFSVFSACMYVWHPWNEWYLCFQHDKWTHWVP
jgi:hypothetical protein